MDFFINFTSYLGSLNTFVVWIILLFFCFLSILFFLKLFSFAGLYVYSALAVIIGNIQVLKTVDFFYSPEPVTLGTILFSSTYLCTDILSEHFGKDKAQKNVLISFVSFLFVTIVMLVTIGFNPSSNDKYSAATNAENSPRECPATIAGNEPLSTFDKITECKKIAG